MNKLANGGYKRLMEKFNALQQRVYNRHVTTLWSLTREETAKSWTLSSEYERALVAQHTGHELRLRVLGGNLVCELVKNPAAT